MIQDASTNGAGKVTTSKSCVNLVFSVSSFTKTKAVERTAKELCINLCHQVLFESTTDGQSHECLDLDSQGRN